MRIIIEYIIGTLYRIVVVIPLQWHRYVQMTLVRSMIFNLTAHLIGP